jgi:hypothetical protein
MLAAQADPNIGDEDGNTPLHLACMMRLNERDPFPGAELLEGALDLRSSRSLPRLVVPSPAPSDKAASSTVSSSARDSSSLHRPVAQRSSAGGDGETFNPDSSASGAPQPSLSPYTSHRSLALSLAHILLSFGAHPLLPNKQGFTPIMLVQTAPARQELVETIVRCRANITCPRATPTLPPLHPQSLMSLVFSPESCPTCQRKYVVLFTSKVHCSICGAQLCNRCKPPSRPLLPHGLWMPQPLCQPCFDLYRYATDRDYVNSLYPYDVVVQDNDLVTSRRSTVPPVELETEPALRFSGHKTSSTADHTVTLFDVLSEVAQNTAY